MFLSYLDETGDDGFPRYSSPLFVLTAIYLRAQDWKKEFTLIRDYRRELFRQYQFPTDWEFHTSKVLYGKRPYTDLNLSTETRIELMNGFCDLMAQTSFRAINVVINKSIIRSEKYDVLENALTYTIQRVENDLIRNHNSANFVLVTDEGRHQRMTSIVRKIQAFNYIPSTINPGTSYRREIKLLIEDPFVKESKASFFIQASDTIGFIVYQFMIMKLGLGSGHNRLQQIAGISQLESWLQRLKPCLNLDADSKQRHGFGIVCYPTA